MSTVEPKNSRRRGPDLVENLYEAVLKLLAEANPLTLTFHQIAQAANTSRTVLYRRWPTVFDLLQAVYTHKAHQLFEGTFFEQLSDTGSMRGDFVELLSRYQQVYEEIGVEVLNNYYYLRLQDKENQHEPAIHTQAVDKHLAAVRTLLQKAQARGEAVRPVADLTLMLPFDLLRLENLIRVGNMSQTRIETLVEEVLLPVFSVSHR
ncbi:MAG: TetR-like C-terminal domain-containing protein [Janthinobacterium lividum]